MEVIKLITRQLLLDNTFKGELRPLIVSAGRKYDIKIDYSEGMDPFIWDERSIGRSYALSRLPGKMQVISTPINNHVSNRRSHTDMVVAIAIEIAHRLGLNINLCRAIAHGHDVGHCPYGPHGGDILNIRHPLNGVIILQSVECLNLTKEVVQGILYHSLDSDSLDNGKKLSNEAYIVALADKFAYLFKDIEDCLRTGLLKDLNLTLPKEILLFGFRNGESFQDRAIDICINALTKESLNEGRVSFSKSEIAITFQKIRKWLYANIYKVLNDRPERAHHKKNLEIVLEYFIAKDLAENLAPEFAISMMTDYDVNWLAKVLRNRKPNATMKKQIYQLSVIEVIRSLKGREIDHTKNPLLDW